MRMLNMIPGGSSIWLWGSGFHGVNTYCRLTGVVLSQVVSELLVWGLGEDCLLPQIRCKVAVCLGNGSVGGLGEIAEGSCLTTGTSVAIFNTGHMQKLLRHRGTDDTSSTWGRDESYNYTTALASNLARYCVGLADLVSPVSTTDRDNRELSQDDGTSDSSCYFLGTLDTQTNMAIEVTDGNESLESGTLTGTGLLLHRHDLKNLVLKGSSQEEINDFKLLDWEREQVDIL